MALPPLVEPAPELTPHEVQRYARHLTLPGIGHEGQRRLKNARVLVVGAGGLGSPVLLYLAAAGVGTLGVVDSDVVDESNLQRQVLHGTPDVDRAKTASARDAVERLNPLVHVQEHDLRLDAATAIETLRGYDLVVDGTDNFATRYLVNDACVLLGLPLVWGSIYRFDGQTSVFWADPPAGSGYEGIHYRDVFPTPPAPGTVPSCAEGGVLGVLCGAIGSVMANEAVKLITGVGEPLLGRLLTFDALTTRWREITVRPDPDRAPIGDLADIEIACAVPAPTPLPAGLVISARRLAERIAQRALGADDFDLVDVREPSEHAEVAIPGARLLPRGGFIDGSAFATLDRARPLILHCASGIRSAEVLAIARAEGYDVVHLEGGILAWASQPAPPS
ncbi:molybdopterin-synthase adenylyltransferase MoeB [Pengzhenrongella frigida]|uniref:Molybdopterin-synthase adenylyltransferase MoeB n=1 Tax=Pengzhenrongella frigida TaxID=1259133 RepID=A0A4Q5MYQ4_9MICO|nr:molybdopterin-synthase adenylyltransferase MoeB [Cellulomonas sp. HLT2-17]RYV50809.1 molybdopterin-synthase adenylyltransferase MoeB [Cellulomonas sp. HLT2-17]